MDFSKPVYALSIDVDWAPEELVVEVAKRIIAHGLSSTFFLTHRLENRLFAESSPEGRPKETVECGLHANILGRLQQGETIDQILDDVATIHCNARGIRGHSLANSTRFYPAFARHRIEYESAFNCYGQHDLHPFWMINNIVQVPLFWEDDLHMEMAAQLGHRPFVLADLQPEKPGLKVFNFHPIHIFLNTEDLDRWEKAKLVYQDVDALRRLVNHETLGIGTFFAQVLDFLALQKGVSTLGQIQAQWRGDHYERSRK